MTVSSTAHISFWDPYVDSEHGTVWCGVPSAGVGLDCPEPRDQGFRPGVKSQLFWGFLGRPYFCEPQYEIDGQCPRSPNGVGVNPAPPTEVSLGAEFELAETWHWNELTIDAWVTTIAIHGVLRVDAPGSPSFEFPLDEPFPADERFRVSRLYLANWETDNREGTCPDFQRPTSQPCDDQVVIGGLHGHRCSPAEPCLYTHEAHGLTWRLNVFGFRDPGNPNPGEITGNVIKPEPVGANPVQDIIAPVIATLTVDENQTTTSLGASDLEPAGGEPVTLTATVEPAPTSGGTVSFEDGGEPIPGCGDQPFDSETGVATCVRTFGAGVHEITASYGGAIGFAASSSDPVTVTVTSTSTTTTVKSSHNPSAVGQKVTYTATVEPAPSGGTVAFTDGDEPIAGCEAVELNGGEASCGVTYGSTASSPHSIAAAYSGSNGFEPSASAPLEQAVGRASTRLDVAPAKRGLLTARVSATLTREHDAAPLGGRQVVFSLRGREFCRATTDASGVASCSKLGLFLLLLGKLDYEAEFAGDEGHLASSGSARF